MRLRTYLKRERGRATALAAHLGVTVSLVSMWASRTRAVPMSRAFEIEGWTKGEVYAELLCPGVSFSRTPKSS